MPPDRDRQGEDHRWRAEPGGAAVDQPVHQRGQGDDRRGPARPSRTGPAASATATRTSAERASRRRPGRLIANTHRQSTVVSKPPSSGPTAPATAPPTAQIPSAFARRRASGNAFTDQRHRCRQHDGRSGALGEPCRDQGTCRRRARRRRPTPAGTRRSRIRVLASRRCGPTGSRRTAATRRTSGCSRRSPTAAPTVPPPSSLSMLGRATLTIRMSRVIRKKPSEDSSRTTRACGESVVTGTVVG